jgi:predicted metal-dependent phosphotriesterase family hydrolase
MAHIETELGKISPDDIGLNNYHDHLITIGGGEERPTAI